MREGDGVTDRQEIEQPQIDGEALTGVGVSAIRRDPSFDGPSVAVGASAGMVGSAGHPKPAEGKSEGPAWRREMTQEAPQRASGDRGPRVDGPDATDTLTEWDVTVTMVRTVDGRKDARDFTMRVPAVDRKGALAAGCGIGDAINEGSRYVWKLASDEAVRVRHVDGCVSGRRADGAPLPPMCCGGWVNSNGGAATLCDPCPPTPLPPISDELREHPGTGQPTEGVPGDDPQAAVERVRKLAEDMADWCSPYDMAPMYAERVLAALEGRPSKW